ncbi:MAG: helix-turn-helix transcriptional regulator [Clostridia bacterium]|nr:helix-turn-helix transcriptional regulator [Clostridia bacterium]
MENRELIAHAVEYAMTNAGDDNITVQAVAEHAGFSIDYFNRLFLAHTGFTVMAYIGYRRLKTAVQLLRTTDKSVLEIALEVGYTSHEGFTKAFKKEYGVTPSEYRQHHKERILSYGDLTDRSITARFLHEHSDFVAVDPEDAVDYLLEKDTKRHMYRASGIRAMGYGVVAPMGDLSKGLICVGDDLKGGYWLELVTDDEDILCEWLKRFENVECFDSVLAPHVMERVLKEHGLETAITAAPENVFFGEPMACDLPQGVSVHPLSCDDKNAIAAFAKGHHTPYIRHLLCERDYLDEFTLDYGVFQGDTLIAVMGGGVENVRGLRLNNCLTFYIGETPLSDELYRAVYTAATNHLLTNGILPFDNLQHSTYAKEHGNFTVTDLDFETVNYRYTVV